MSPTTKSRSKPIVYLDNCVFNRPYDDQRSIEIRLESEAKLFIQQKIKNGDLELVWSYILEFENANNPFRLRREAILYWKIIASRCIVQNERILNQAEKLRQIGLKSADALHIACAIEARSDFFLTTDRGILRKMREHPQISVLNPIEFVMLLGEPDDY
jgi:predicted nucleic acid-binding protein